MKKIIMVCRHLIVVPVVGSILLAVGASIMGFGRIIASAINLYQYGDFSVKSSKMMGTSIIEIIDLFLIATVAYITGVGLWMLFIADKEDELPFRLKIKTLKDLEHKIIGVLVVVLAVSFLGQVSEAEDFTQILYYGAGTALVIGSLALFMRFTESSKGPNEGI